MIDDDGDPAEDLRQRAEEAGSGKMGGRVMRWGAAGAGLLLVALIALSALLRSPPPEPRLGRVGSWTGVTATGLPPAGLETVWERRIDPTSPAFVRGGPGIVASGGLVRVGGVVLDRATGEFVGASRIAASSRERLEGRLVGGDLVVVDTLTGQVRFRQAVVRPDGQCCWSVESAGSGWLVTSDRQSVIIDSDGAEVARVAALPLAVDRAKQDAAAVPLRRIEQGGFEAPLVLVDTTTGEVVYEGDGGRTTIADVTGEHALVATLAEDAELGNLPQEWEIDLLDATTGRSQGRFVLPSAEPPRLLGATDDGDLVLGVLGDNAVQVFRVGSSPSPVMSVAVPDERRSTDVFGQSTVRATVGLVDDLLVVLHGDEVRGRELEGDLRWRRDSGGASWMVVGDGLVALDDDPETTEGTVRVLDAADGSPVAEFPDGIDSQMLGVENLRPLTVVEGHVGLGHGTWRAPAGSVRLSSSRWLDMRSGAETPADDLLEPLLDEDADLVGEDWWMHGVLDDGTPLLATGLHDGRLRVAGPTSGPLTVEIPTRDGLGPYAQPIGAAADHLFVPVTDNDASRFATHLVSWHDAKVRTLPGLVGVVTTGNLLVATEGDPRGEAAGRFVGVDVATGQRRWRLDGPPVPLDRHVRHDADLLVIADGFSVTAIRLEDGSTGWHHAATEELAQPVVLSDQGVLLASTAGEVVALDRDTGDEMWRTAIGTPVADLAGAGGGVVAGTFDGQVVVLDGRGRETQRITVPDAPVHQLASLGDTVVATTGRRIIGLRADGGATPPPGEVQLP